MQLKRIQVGKWYETKAGVGVVEQVGGTFPPSVRIRIVAPFPRGLANVSPRDVLKEVDPPAPATTEAQPVPKAPETVLPRCQCFAKAPSGEAAPCPNPARWRVSGQNVKGHLCCDACRQEWERIAANWSRPVTFEPLAPIPLNEA
jgi:hypothetical protein